MMRHVLAVSSALLLLAAPALADGVGHHTETFDSPDCVGPGTTAYWNTSGSELTLHGLTLDAVDWYEIGVSTVVADLAVSGNRAYAATSAGLHILDISDPVAVAWLGVYAPGNSFTAVDVDGRHVFLGEGSNSIRVVDVSDPTSPSLIGLTGPPSTVHDLVVSGNTLYAACGSAGVRSYSVKTLPGAPLYQDTFSTTDAVGVAVSGAELYIADATDGLIAINTTDPLVQSILPVGGTGGQARAVAVRGTLAYVVCSGGTDLLQVVNVRELDPTAALGALAHASATGIALTVTGDYAYVANGANGMVVVDISDKGAPEELAALHSPTVDVVGVHVAGEYAFLADDTGLRVIDVADPVLPPFPVAQLAVDGNPGRITVNGDHAYVCDANGGLLRVMDISNPISPQLLNSVWTHGDALDIEIAGDYAFVTDGKPALSTLDVSNPSLPRVGGFIRPQMNAEPPGEVTDVLVIGDLAFVSVGHSDTRFGNGYCIVDLADPEYPVVLETEPGCDLNPNSRYAQGIDVVGDLIYIANGGAGLQVVDRLGGCSSDELINLGGEARAVEVSGDYAYVAAGEAGLVIVDVSGFGDPVLALALESTLDTPGIARDVLVNGSIVYVADDTGGLRVIDVTDPAAPAEVVAGHQPTSGAVCGLAIDGDYLYSANHSEGLVIYDITTPDAPDTTDLHLYNGWYWSSYGIAYVDVTVSNDVAYVTDDLSGLHVVDVSTPSRPVSFAVEGSSACRLPGSAQAVALYDDYALVADGEFGLEIIDVSVEAQPRILYCLDTQGNSRSVCAHGDEVYFTDFGPRWHETGFISVDVTDPTMPTYAGCMAKFSDNYDVSIGDIAVAGDLAYMSDQWSNLLTVDISEPTDPFRADGDEQSDVTYTNNARDVALDGDYIYVASSWYGVSAVDVADNDTLAIRRGRIPAVGYDAEPMGVAVSGDYCFVADANLGLRVVDVTNPRSLGVNDVLDGYQTPCAWDVAVDGDYAYVADHDSGLWVFSVFSREADPERCLAQSIPVDEDALDVARARLNATCSGDSIAWELGLSNTPDAWRRVAPGTDVVFAEADTGLRWRATLHPVNIGEVPSCQDLALDWWYDCALIDTVADIPGDQGGWTRVVFARSGYDFADDASPVANYAVWRKVGDAELVARALQSDPIDREGKRRLELARSADDPRGIVPDLGPGHRAVHLDGRDFVIADGSRGDTFPPDEVWEYVAEAPAVQQETYTVAVPTYQDGEHPRVVIYLEFADGTNQVTPVFGDPFTATIYLEGFGGAEGLSAVQLSLDESFTWLARVYDPVNPNWLQIGDPTTGWTMAGECMLPDVDGRVGFAEVTYYSDGTTGTIEILPDPSGPYRTVFDCGVPSVESDWCVRLSPSGNGGVGDEPPNGECSSATAEQWTEYRVSAHRSDPSLWYLSPPASGYSVDDLAPTAPGGLKIPARLALEWSANGEPDVDHYTVYVTDSNDASDRGWVVSTTSETSCALPDSTTSRYVFVTATDLSGNESEPSDLAWNSGTAIPDRKFLAQNTPNPFNPVTTIRFGLPAEADVSIEVFDVAGRLVTVLAEGLHQPGEHEVLWSGRDGAGRSVAAGVYFYSMKSGEFDARRKMILLK